MKTFDSVQSISNIFVKISVNHIKKIVFNKIGDVNSYIIVFVFFQQALLVFIVSVWLLKNGGWVLKIIVARITDMLK